MTAFTASFRLALIFMLIALLGACGGGSSGGSAPSGSATTSTAPGVSITGVGPASPLVGSLVSLTAKATGSNLSYAWNYGDGSPLDTSSGTNATHTYVNSGSYTVTVTVTDTVSNASASASVTLVVLSPTLSLVLSTSAAAPIETGQAVPFNTSPTIYYPSVPYSNYSWDFGDGSPAAKGTTSYMTHIFVTPGTYTVTVSATDSSYDVGTASTTVQVSAAASTPTVSATLAVEPLQPVISPGSGIYFVGGGTGTGVLSYAWNFGDQSTATGQTVSHSYSNAGTYTVTMTITDSLGHTSTATKAVTVSSSQTITPPASTPVAALGISTTPTQPTTKTTTTFTGAGSGGTSPLSYSWTFGDGNSAAASSLNTATHVYSTAGSYAVTLTVTDANQKTATATATLVVANTISSSIIAGVLDPAGSSDGTGTAAQFSAPEATATDSKGNIYVADTGNNTIRKITPAGVVSTLAGTPNNGCTLSDGKGPAASFCSPAALAVDSSGNIYVAEQNDIRKVTPGGVVTTLAGNGYGTQSGATTAPTFYRPGGIAIDASNTVYVADTGDSSIRTVSQTGAVTTLAAGTGCGAELDGPSSSATFCDPTGIAVDAGHNVYLSDANPNYGGGTIRKIDSQGNVTTLAGYARATSCHLADGTGSAASFCSPTSLVLKGGTIYVADTGNNSIRVISSTNQVTTLAGVGQGNVDGTGASVRFNHPTGLSVDGAGNFYIADTGNNLVRKMTAGGSVITFAGTTITGPISSDGKGLGARFDGASAIVTDSSGNIYVADTGSQKIRKITMPGAVVTTLAGGALPANPYSCTPKDGSGNQAAFCNLEALAVDSNANVYAIDGSTIREISSAGVVTTLAGNSYYPCYSYGGSINNLGSSATFCNPRSLAVDTNGNVFVADTGFGLIREISPTGQVSTLAGTQTSGYGYCSGESDGTGPAATFCFPIAMTIDTKGNLYVADEYGDTVRKVTHAGVVSTLAGESGVSGSSDSTGAFASFSYPSAIAINSSGQLYVLDNNGVRSVSAAGAVVTIPGLPISAGIYGSPTLSFALLPSGSIVYPNSGQVIMMTSPL